jgi:hypothetical protein
VNVQRIVGTLVVLSGLFASAETTLFSNLVEPGGQYGPDSVDWGSPSGPLPGNRRGAAAVRFSVTADSILSSFQAPIFVRSGPDDVLAYLLNDASGVPGSVIETYEVSNLPPDRRLTAIRSVLRPVLAAGEAYWFAMSPNPQSFGGWALTKFQGSPISSSNFAVAGVIGDPQSTWILGNGGPGSREGTLVVTGEEAVPEPGTLAAGCLSVLAMLARLRKPRCPARRTPAAG